MDGMVSAPIFYVKPLSLIPVAVLGCASGGHLSATHGYVSASAPHPLNVEPTQARMQADSILASAPAPQPGYVTAPAPASAQASAGPPRHSMHAMHAPSATDEGTETAWLDPGAPNPMPVREAIAVLVPTKGSNVRGVVQFRDYGDGLEVSASVSGLPGGVHAYHVHVYGDCGSPDAESAGPHFHFRGSSFDKEVPTITGNLGELRAKPRAMTVHNTQIQASLHGKYSLIGRAVVVHEKGNDPASPPDGAAGKRLACGVIGATGPLPEKPGAATATAHHP